MSERGYGVMLVALSAALWSTAGLFVRMANLDTWTILGWRSLFAATALGGFVFIQNRSKLNGLLENLQWPGVVAVALSVVSSTAYVAALRLTTVANVMII